MQNGMAKDNIIYKTIAGLPQESLNKEIANLYSEIFKDADLDFFNKRVKDNPMLFSVLAYSKERLIGFKIGYPYSKTTFYSWVGGVLPQFRCHGIGSQLANLQEDYVKTRGFNKLRTKSMNSYKPMMILNLKNGFDITKVYTNTKGQTKIVFEKMI